MDDQKAITKKVDDDIDTDYNFYKQIDNEYLSKVWTHLDTMGFKGASDFNPDNFPKGFEEDILFQKYECAWVNLKDAARYSYECSHNTETYQEEKQHFNFEDTSLEDVDAKFKKLKKAHKKLLNHCFNN